MELCAHRVPVVKSERITELDVAAFFRHLAPDLVRQNGELHHAVRRPTLFDSLIAFDELDLHLDIACPSQDDAAVGKEAETRSDDGHSRRVTLIVRDIPNFFTLAIGELSMRHEPNRLELFAVSPLTARQVDDRFSVYIGCGKHPNPSSSSHVSKST